MFDREPYKLESGKLQSFAFPGGYPLYYLCADGECLCGDCASLPECEQAEPSDTDWFLVGAGIHYEGSPITCAHCGKEIESAYGDENENGE